MALTGYTVMSSLLTFFYFQTQASKGSHLALFSTEGQYVVGTAMCWCL
jgi:hypothetical protein